MNSGKRLVSALTLTLALLSGICALAAEPERGQLLYENHCTDCHESIIHIRDERKARSSADIRAQILRWQDVLNLSWTPQEVEDVLGFLNDRYYHYPLNPK